MISFWKKWDETERTSAARIVGLCIAGFAIFSILSSSSYLLHWKQDMSAPETVRNLAGTAGSTFGGFLIRDLFGLGSFALMLILIAISLKLIAGKWNRPLVKTALISLFGAMTASLILAFIGTLAGIPFAFGSGLGGCFGTYLCNYSQTIFGSIITGVFIFIILLCFLFFSSRRFTIWFSTLGTKKATVVFEKECAEPLKNEDPEPLVQTDTVPVFPKPTEPELPASSEPEVSSVPEPSDKQTVEGSFEIIEDEGLDTKITKPLEPIDNRLDPPEGLPKFKFPPLTILKSYDNSRHDVTTEELTCNNNKIRAALANYKIKIDEVKAIVGPTITLYKVYPSAGVQIAQIKRLQEDIALSLNAKGVRVVTLSDSVGIEVANNYASMVPLKALLNDEAFRNSKAELPVAIGYTIQQKVKVFDLADAPHLLIAGATKQGKSVGLNIIVSSLLYSKHPSELKFVFIDPKMVEFSAYGRMLKHYLAVLPETSEAAEIENAIVKKPKNADIVLRSLCKEMDDRYELLAKAGVNKITLYNEKYKQRHLRPDQGHRYLPYLVCVVDEYADLTMTIGGTPESRTAARNITASIIRLAQKGRAAGLHVILATQRPSVDVISGIIKSNFPMRIAFRVASRVDSMTILDAPGAEKLIGNGDMLLSAGIDSERIQCGYVSGQEIDDITEFISSQQGFAKSYNTPYYLPIPEDANGEGGGGMTDMTDLDERFVEAANLVVTSQKASTSYLQTKLGMGFAKAARVMEQLESAGIVGPQDGAKPRQVLVSDLNSLQPILDSFAK